MGLPLLQAHPAEQHGLLVEGELNPHPLGTAEHPSLLTFTPEAAEIKTILTGIKALDRELAAPGIAELKQLGLIAAGLQACVARAHQHIHRRGWR